MTELERLNSKIPWEPGWDGWLRCDVGWGKLVEAFADLALVHNWTALQIKEKFGLLRIYAKANGSVPVNSQFIDALEEYSRYVCEVCGNSRHGEVTTTASPGSYWIRTLCNGCRK